MRHVKKILDIETIMPDYKEGCPVNISIQNIRHTSVHRHLFDTELVMCLNGEVNVKCNHEVFHLKPGQIANVDTEDLHCLFSKTDNITVILHINLKSVSIPWSELEYSYFACQDFYIQEYQTSALFKIKSIILSAACLYAANGNLSQEGATQIGNQIISILVEYFDWFNYRDYHSVTNDELRKRMQTIFSYCFKNYAQKIKISDLTNLVHINPNYFSQYMLKSGYGSFNNMIGYIRCYVAQNLLISSELPVTTIAQNCGFSSEKYFYKYYKYWWHSTPTEFRNWFREYITESDMASVIDSKEAMDFLQPYVTNLFINHTLKKH